MKKNACIIVVILSFLIHPVYGQERIKRLIPQLQNVSTASSVCFSQGNSLCGSNQKVFSVNISDNPRDSFGTSLLDSLVTAFKEEMAYATESDHYEKHVEGHDSITFIVAYGDKSQSYMTQSTVSTSLRPYFAFVSTATLVLADNKVSFNYNSREPLGNADPFYDQPLKEKVDLVAKMKGVKKTKVKRIRLGNAEQGSSEETVIQFEVPKEASKQVFDDFNKLITEYRQMSKQRLDIFQSRYRARIIFGEYFENTAYEISFSPEQNARITVFPKADKNPTISNSN